MTNHPERIYALLVEANPVSDPEDAREIIDRRRGPLTLVRQRRHEMTDREVAPKRPRWMIPAAAAAAIVLFIGVMVMVSDGSDTEQDVADTTAVGESELERAESVFEQLSLPANRTLLEASFTPEYLAENQAWVTFTNRFIGDLGGSADATCVIEALEVVCAHVITSGLRPGVVLDEQTTRFSFEDGRISAWDFENGQPDLLALDAEGVAGYQAWMLETWPEEVDGLFLDGELVLGQRAAAGHVVLVPQYIAFLTESSE